MDNYKLNASFNIIDPELDMTSYVLQREGDFIVLKMADDPEACYIHIKAAVLIAEAINQLAKIKP